jgi:hypothetical protein
MRLVKQNQQPPYPQSRPLHHHHHNPVPGNPYRRDFRDQNPDPRCQDRSPTPQSQIAALYLPSQGRRDPLH